LRRFRFSRVPETGLLFLSFFLNFSWEVVHTYFYTLKDSDFNAMLYGWLHCTFGDVMITLASFWLVSLMARNRRWFLELNMRNFAGFVMIGVIYTLFSELTNVQIFRSWGYNESMPVIPLVRVGLTPVLQWLVIPSATIFLLRCRLLPLLETARNHPPKTGTGSLPDASDERGGTLSH